jgi:predicted molibdopterin-dependent oxidoreductase YjgC
MRGNLPATGHKGHLKMINLTIDGQPVSVAPGSTVLDAADQLGIAIPTLCHVPGACGKGGSCMVCVVLNEANGALIPACTAVAQEGMRLCATSPELTLVRRNTLEMLLAEHLGDCQGMCELACPAGLDLPRILHLCAGREFKQAAELISSYPCESCPERCEKACRRGRHDQPLAIKAIIRNLAARAGGQPDCQTDRTQTASVPRAHYQHHFGPVDEAAMRVFLQEASPEPRLERLETEDQLAREAARCLHCDCRAKDDCQLRAVADELQAKQSHFRLTAPRDFAKIFVGRLIFEPGKCIKCGQCIALAKSKGFDSGPAFSGRGFELHIDAPLGQTWNEAVAGIEDELCAVCPTGAMRIAEGMSKP